MTHFIAWNNKIDLPLELSIHSTFNVAKLSPSDVGDDFSYSRTNPLGDDDKNHSVHSTFNVAELSPFDVDDDFSDSRTILLKREMMIRITVFQLDLLHNPRPRRFNKHSYFIYKIG